jgi:hypothetical protein
MLGMHCREHRLPQVCAPPPLSSLNIQSTQAWDAEQHDADSKHPQGHGNAHSDAYQMACAMPTATGASTLHCTTYVCIAAPNVPVQLATC